MVGETVYVYALTWEVDPYSGEATTRAWAVSPTTHAPVHVFRADFDVAPASDQPFRSRSALSAFFASDAVVKYGDRAEVTTGPYVGVYYVEDITSDTNPMTGWQPYLIARLTNVKPSSGD